MQNSTGAGRPSIVYILNYNQALLYCTLSQAPRAADVREALIRTFDKFVKGELAPVTNHMTVADRGG